MMYGNFVKLHNLFNIIYYKLLITLLNINIAMLLKSVTPPYYTIPTHIKISYPKTITNTYIKIGDLMANIFSE